MELNLTLAERVIRYLTVNTNHPIALALQYFEVNANQKLELFSDSRFLLELAKVSRMRQIILEADASAAANEALSRIRKSFNEVEYGDAKLSEILRMYSDVFMMMNKTTIANQDGLIDLMDQTLTEDIKNLTSLEAE